MQRLIRITRRGFLAASLIALSLQPATAQTAYPSKPITIVLGNSAGSGGDLLCRVLASGLSASLKQMVIVENRPGANSTIASLAVVNAKPDGYTLLFGNASSTVINQAVQKNVRFDARTDLAPIAQVGAGGVALVATPNFPANSMKEFIAEARANPGKYNYASWGIGSQGHLVGEWIQTRSGISLTHVPYKSITAITQDLQGGMINIGFTDVASAMPFVKQGRLKVLGSDRFAALTGHAGRPADVGAGCRLHDRRLVRPVRAEGHPGPRGGVAEPGSQSPAGVQRAASGSCSSTSPTRPSSRRRSLPRQ